MRDYLKVWRAAQKADLASKGIIDRHAAAALLGVTIRTLQRWHDAGGGPRRIASPDRSVSYSRSEIEEWMSTKMQTLHSSGHPPQESPDLRASSCVKMTKD